jgi:hypothetical protein
MMFPANEIRLLSQFADALQARLYDLAIFNGRQGRYEMKFNEIAAGCTADFI